MPNCWFWNFELKKGFYLLNQGLFFNPRVDESLAIISTLLALFVKSCPIGLELHSSFDASSPLGYCLQNHEMLLNKGMKYWNSRFKALGSRTFIATLHIVETMIGWKCSRKKRTKQTQFNPNLLLNWVSCLVEGQCFFFFFLVFLKIFYPIWTNKGF